MNWIYSQAEIKFVAVIGGRKAMEQDLFWGVDIVF
jgi:hypothetical protein